MIRNVSNQTDAVVKAIKQAAQATGVDFAYLMETAKREASLNPDAKAKESSASGLFQFIDQTWLSALKNHGESIGLGDLAAQIDRTGNYYQLNSDQSQQVLDLRFDPDTSALVAAAHTRANADYLRGILGHEPSSGDLYTAHFLGRSGAGRLIEEEAKNGTRPADTLFPQAAKANPAIFYHQDGKARSLSDVRHLLAEKMNATTSQSVAPKAATAGIEDTPAQATSVISPLAVTINQLPLINSLSTDNSDRGSLSGFAQDIESWFSRETWQEDRLPGERDDRRVGSSLARRFTGMQVSLLSGAGFTSQG